MSTAPIFDRIHARSTELGEGLTIRRALPTKQRRRVGAWCFLDHIGPVQFEGQALANGGLHVGGTRTSACRPSHG